MSTSSCIVSLWVFKRDRHGDLKDNALEMWAAQAASNEDRMLPNPSCSMLTKASRGAGQPGRWPMQVNQPSSFLHKAVGGGQKVAMYVKSVLTRVL